MVFILFSSGCFLAHSPSHLPLSHAFSWYAKYANLVNPHPLYRTKCISSKYLINLFGFATLDTVIITPRPFFYVLLYAYGALFRETLHVVTTNSNMLDLT
jgi:hypothetical protein